MKLKLANCRWGRVLLHLACITTHPKHRAWHWQGILREL
jgi:hypothetical protein